MQSGTLPGEPFSGGSPHLGNNRVGFRGIDGSTPNFSTDYYPFGLQYQARLRQPLPKNNYLYNNKELQESLTFFDYGARYYDSVVGRWNSIDRLTEKMRSWSPYTFSLNNPMLFIDPDGQFPIIIHVRSFAPFRYFGAGLWHGDNRGFTTDLNASSRIKQVTSYETETQVGTTKAYGAVSMSRYGAFAYSDAYLNDGQQSITTRGNSINTHLYGNNDAMFPGFPPKDGGPTWDIDVHSNLLIDVAAGEDGNQILSITGSVSGDAFPSAEAFVTDADGNSVFLNVSPAAYNGTEGPFIGLAGDNKRPMFDVNTSIIVNDKGVFTGVRQGDNIINIEEWNKRFEEQNSR